MARSGGPRIIQMEVESLDGDGLGVGAFEGRKVRVKGVLPGSVVRARIVKRRRGVWLGLPEEGARATVCTAFPVCGGCSVQQLDGAMQLELKGRALIARLEAVGVAPARVATPCHGPQFGYRRRARLGVRHIASIDETLVGFRESFGSRVARAAGCPVLVAPLQRVLASLRTHIGRLESRASVPQVEVAAGDANAAFIVRHLAPLSHADRAVLQLVARESGAQPLTQSGGYDTVRNLEGAPPRSLEYGLMRLGLSLEFSPMDFVQVNAAINDELVAEAAGELAGDDSHRVLDLFCGIGNFSLACARAGARVIGVEGDAGLVERARANASRNGLTPHTEFVAADLYREPGGDLEDAFAWCDRVLIDPPRSGAGAALRKVCESKASKVVYVSCHPESFASDAAALVRDGFTLSKVRLFDMFPHTTHVEVLGVFDRR